MTIAEKIYEKINSVPYSYGESVALILENSGKSISYLPEEDYVFSDNSILRLTNEGIKVIQLLTE